MCCPLYKDHQEHISSYTKLNLFSLLQGRTHTTERESWKGSLWNLGLCWGSLRSAGLQHQFWPGCHPGTRAILKLGILDFCFFPSVQEDRWLKQIELLLWRSSSTQVSPKRVTLIMFTVIECPSLCFASYIVMSGLVAGLFHHNHGMTLSDYCFYFVSDVYIPLGTSQPALSRSE